VNADPVESVLNEFRAWLHQGGAQSDLPSAEEEAIDLNALLREMVALKHEVNLQTRASRAQLDQNAEAVKQLAQALAAVERQGAESQTDGDEGRLRPLLKTMVDVYDALALARREASRVQEIVEPLLPPEGDAAEPPPEEPSPRRSLLAQWLGGGDNGTAAALRHELARHRAALERQRQAGDRARQLLTSLVAGYTMGVQRLERALQQYGLEVMECVGRPFDPERMEAVEVVRENGREPGEVVEEVRRGYVWRGRVFRFAQVRVAKP
jgi:molecular chaperone GrpE